MSSTRSVSLRQAPPVFVTIGKTRYQLEVTDGKNRVLNGERDEHVWASIAKKIFKGQKEAPALFATLEGDFSPVSKKGKAEQRDVEIKKIGTADAIDAKKYTDKIKFDPKTKEKIEEKIGTLLGSNAPAKPQKPAKMDMDELEDTSDVEEESEIESMEEEEELTSIKLPKIPEFPEFPDPAESADLREQHHSLPLFLNDHELNDTDPNPYNDLFTQIASQALWMRPSVVIDPRKLREKVAEKLESKKASNEDCKKMHEILVAAKDHDGRVLDRLLTGRKPIFGAAKTLNRNEVTALLGKATPPKSGTKEAELLRQAFANYLRNHTDAASNTDYPPFFYEALDSVIKDEKKIDGIVIVRGTKPNFKLVHAGKRTKTFNPSKTAFLCAHDFSNYKVFERTKLNDITTDPTTLSTTKDPKLATQYKGKHVEIEDNNDCAAEALTDATFQYSKKYYPQHIWNGQVKEKGLEMRRDVMKHLYNYPEEFHEENDFNQVISSFTQLSSNKSAFRTGINDKKTREAIQELISRTTGKYTTEEKNFLIKTYALYGAEPKRALDSLFFLGFAKMTGINIVLVQTVGKKDQILSIFSKEPVEQIEKENCLFIHFDPPASGGSTGHYTSLNRLHKSFTADKGTPEIDKIIKQYNINTLIPPFHRNALIEALSQDEPDARAVKECLEQVKKHDLHGYLALQAHFGKDPLTKGPKALTKLLKGQDLEKIMKSGPHLESRAKFYTTLKEYKVGDAEFVKSRVKELKKCDPIGYLMLEELLEGESPEESDSIRAISEMHSKNPMDYFEKEIEKRPYLEARAAFFQALEKARANKGDATQKALEKAFKRLEKEDLQGYLSVNEHFKTNAVQSLIKVNGDTQNLIHTIKFTIRTQNHKSALKIMTDAMNAYEQKASKSNTQALKKAIEDLKTAAPLFYMSMSMGIRKAKPEEHLDDVIAKAKAQQLFVVISQTYSEVFEARNKFFLALKLHEHKTGKAYDASMTDALNKLKAKDRDGYTIICQLVGGKDKLKANLAPLKKISLDQFQGKLGGFATASSHSSSSDSSESDDLDVSEAGSSIDDDSDEHRSGFSSSASRASQNDSDESEEHSVSEDEHTSHRSSSASSVSQNDSDDEEYSVSDDDSDGLRSSDEDQSIGTGLSLDSDSD